jgi:hypothetical protein
MIRHFVERVTPLLRSKLDPGEILQGVVAAIEVKAVMGTLFAMGMTDRRLLLQPVDRHHQHAKGEARSIYPEKLASVEAGPASVELGALVVTFHTTDGQKLSLSVMRGGTGLIGAIGGGKAQREGVLALSAWLQRATASQPGEAEVQASPAAEVRTSPTQEATRARMDLAWSDDPERAEVEDLMDALEAETSDPATVVGALRARVDRVEARARALLNDDATDWEDSVKFLLRATLIAGMYQERRALASGDPAFVARAAKTREAVGVATDKTLGAQTSADPDVIAEAVQSLRQAFGLASD